MARIVFNARRPLRQNVAIGGALIYGNLTAVAELNETDRLPREKSYLVTVLLVIFVGQIGGHWFYLGRTRLGAFRLAIWAAGVALLVAMFHSSQPPMFDSGSTLVDVTLVLIGLIDLWWLVDIGLVVIGSVRDSAGRRL